MHPLSQRIASAFTFEEPGAAQALLHLIYRLQFGPVPLKALEQHEQALIQQWDEVETIGGHIHGCLLTHIPTRHRCAFGYTWCAFDALLIAELLGTSLHLESTCPLSGEHLIINEASASKVWISLPAFPTGQSLRQDFCCKSHCWTVIPQPVPHDLFFVSLDQARHLAALVIQDLFGSLRSLGKPVLTSGHE